MRILELDEDGSNLRLWISCALDFHNDSLWHPETLLTDINKNVGYPQPIGLASGHDERLISGCMRASWDVSGDWNAACIKYLIKAHDFDVVFSHFHNIDLQGHALIQFMNKGSEKLPAETYQHLFRQVYIQADQYIGKYLELLDDGWTIMIVSDHGQTANTHHYPQIGGGAFIDGIKMVELGYTVLKKDENGNILPKIDWAKTKAISWQGAALQKSNPLIIPDNIRLLFLPPAIPEMNPIEQIWKEIRKRGFRNEIFQTLDGVVDRLCDTICSLSISTIHSITGRNWIVKCFN